LSGNFDYVYEGFSKLVVGSRGSDYKGIFFLLLGFWLEVVYIFCTEGSFFVII